MGLWEVVPRGCHLCPFGQEAGVQPAAHGARHLRRAGNGAAGARRSRSQPTTRSVFDHGSLQRTSPANFHISLKSLFCPNVTCNHTAKEDLENVI